MSAIGVASTRLAASQRSAGDAASYAAGSASTASLRRLDSLSLPAHMPASSRADAAAASSSVVPAAAGMIKVFLELTTPEDQHSGLDIRKQTEELQPLLSDLGFYDHFKQSDAVRE